MTTSDHQATLDLTPFGFTPTESAAYAELVRSGPQTGYALARRLSIARANAYQALRGLLAKGAVTVVSPGRPERYRPLAPSSLLTLLAQQATRRLEALESALAALPQTGGPALVEVEGERVLLDLALRTAARAKGPVGCLAPARCLAALAPAWHKRASAGEETSLWVVGVAGEAFPEPAFEPAGTLEPSAIAAYFPEPPVLLVATEAALSGMYLEDGFRGHWTSHPALVGTARAALDRLAGLAKRATG